MTRSERGARGTPTPLGLAVGDELLGRYTLTAVQALTDYLAIGAAVHAGRGRRVEVLAFTAGAFASERAFREHVAAARRARWLTHHSLATVREVAYLDVHRVVALGDAVEGRPLGGATEPLSSADAMAAVRAISGALDVARRQGIDAPWVLEQVVLRGDGASSPAVLRWLGVALPAAGAWSDDRERLVQLMAALLPSAHRAAALEVAERVGAPHPTSPVAFGDALVAALAERLGVAPAAPSPRRYAPSVGTLGGGRNATSAESHERRGERPGLGSIPTIRSALDVGPAADAPVQPTADDVPGGGRLAVHASGLAAVVAVGAIAGAMCRG